MIPDPDFYHQCINNAYRDLLNAAEALRKPVADKTSSTSQVAPKKKPPVKKAASKVSATTDSPK
jgi:hypothetical protein